MPMVVEPLPCVSEEWEKYQVAAEAAMMNWAQPMRKALIQSKANST